MARYRKLNLPTYFAGVNSDLTPRMSGGQVADVEITYPTDPVKQYLRYGSMWMK